MVFPKDPFGPLGEIRTGHSGCVGDHIRLRRSCCIAGNPQPWGVWVPQLQPSSCGVPVVYCYWRYFSSGSKVQICQLIFQQAWHSNTLWISAVSTATTPSAQWVATISQPRLSSPLKEELACTLHVDHTAKPSEPGTSPDIHSQQNYQKTVLWANITHPASPCPTIANLKYPAKKP
jgi:hypothetical protein